MKLKRTTNNTTKQGGGKMDEILATYNAEKLFKKTGIPQFILIGKDDYILAEKSDFIRHPELKQCKVFRVIESERDASPSMFYPSSPLA